MRDTLRARLLSIVRELLGEDSGRVEVAFRGEKNAADFRFDATATVDDDDDMDDEEEVGESAPDDSAAVLKIVDVLERATRPMKPRAIARAAKLSPNGSFFKDAITKLRREKRIYRPDETVAEYWLTARAVPD